MAKKKEEVKNPQTKEAQPSPSTKQVDNKKPNQVEIEYLVAAHNFFSKYDRVHGEYSYGWGEALNRIADVANSLIQKQLEANKKTQETAPKEPHTPPAN